MKPKLSAEALEYFKQQGRKGGKIGGKIAADNMTAEQRRDRALKAVTAREAKRKKSRSK